MVEIAKFTDADRDAVRDICFRTGFLGRSMEGIIDYGDLFLDLSLNYFFTYGGDCRVVAREDEKTVGYVLVATDKNDYYAYNRSYYIKRAVSDVAAFRLFRKKELKYYARMLLYYLNGELKMPEFEEYPALLHVNVAPGRRRAGIGGKMFEEAFKCLEKSGCPGVQLQTTSANDTATPFFKKHGFIELASKETNFYKAYGMGTVRLIAMGKKLQ